MGGANNSIRAGGLVLFATLLLLPSLTLALDPPDPLNVLFVANGYYDQEDDLEDHFLDLGCTVTKMKDYKVKGTTNLAPYHLIVITEFAPGIPTSGINNIKASGKPVLIVEYWDFWYSYKLGLTTTDNCGYVGTDTLELVDAESRTARYVGLEPKVYSTPYTVYGISELDLKPGVEPVAWSSVSFGEHAVIIDRARGIAATGVYDTRKYTSEAWRLFDEVLDRITPIGPRWADTEAMLQGFVDSGLLSYIRDLTGREPAEEVLSNAWSEVFANNLHDIAHIVEWELKQKGPGIYLLFPPVFKTVSHDPYDDEEHSDMLWFMGEHQEDGQYDTPFYGDWIEGVDLGISARLYDHTYFYMGDTLGEAGSTGCVPNADGAVQCNDAVVRLADYETNPTDGIDAIVVSDPYNSGNYLPQTIEGVHRNYGNDVWDAEDANAPFSVPTGASSRLVDTIFSYSPFPGYTLEYTLPLPSMRLWYGTQITRNDETDKTGKSWVGCSLDGQTFDNCYRYGDAPNYGYAFFSKERFIDVSPVEIDAWDLAAMGDDAPPHPAGSTGGTLLFGAGHPYRCSEIYLAYVDNEDFRIVDDDKHPINVKYYKGPPGNYWIDEEDFANPIFEPECLKDLDDLIEPEQQALWDDWYDILAASYEEKAWRVALGDESYPLLSVVSGCDYSGSCEPSQCMVFAGALTGQLDSTLCHMCTEEQVDECVAHIMEDFSFGPGGYPWPATDGFGELSVKLAKFDESFSAYVMLSNHQIPDWPERPAMVAAAQVGAKNNPITDHSTDGFSRFDYTWDRGRVFYRWAPASSPWSWSEPVDTGTPGYGPYVIDEFSHFFKMWTDGIPSYPFYVANLWFTTSVWHGDLPPHDKVSIPGHSDH